MNLKETGLWEHLQFVKSIFSEERKSDRAEFEFLMRQYFEVLDIVTARDGTRSHEVASRRSGNQHLKIELEDPDEDNENSFGAPKQWLPRGSRPRGASFSRISELF